MRKDFWGCKGGTVKKKTITILLLFVLCFVHSVAAEVPGKLEFAPVVDEIKGYTWSDFLMGKSCRQHLIHLQNLPFATNDQENLKKQMQTYCLDSEGLWKDLLISFRRSKKDLLVNQTLNENSFVRYLKVVPLLLFDLHMSHPSGNTLLAQLDRIQNAIRNKNPEQVLELMQNLSPNQQLFLMPIFNEAASLVDFQKALEGGYND